jgi:threonine/homoserine/homoserine lactone efflux protein
MYLGVRAFRSQAVLASPRLKPASLTGVFAQGVVTNVFNPKVALFFLAFLPQFVDQSRGNPALQVIALGLLFDTTGTLVNLAVALGSSRVGAHLRGTGRANAVLHKLTGVLFIGIGFRLLLGNRR